MRSASVRRHPAQLGQRADYLAEVREADPIYGREGLAHSVALQWSMNKVLVDNVALGPWVHIGRRMQHASMVS